MEGTIHLDGVEWYISIVGLKFHNSAQRELRLPHQRKTLVLYFMPKR